LHRYFMLSLTSFNLQLVDGLGSSARVLTSQIPR
jgi:hypothetical protein